MFRFLKVKLILLMMLLSSGELFSQEVSPLHQYISLNPMLKRNPEFRELHKNLSDQVNSTNYGFYEDIIDRELQKFRTFVDRLELKIEFSETLYVLKIKSEDNLEGVKIGEFDPNITYNELTEEVANKFATALVNMIGNKFEVLDDNTTSDEVRKSILYSIH